MKQFYNLKFFLIALFAIFFGGGNALAEDLTATFDFTAQPNVWNITPLVNNTTKGDNIIAGKKLIVNDITLTSTNGSSNGTCIYLSTANKANLRIYKNGGSLTFTAAVGCTLKSIAFTKTTGSISLTPSTGTLASDAWSGTGSETTVTFSATATTQINKIVVTYEAVSTGPTITAADVTYAADITKGEIAYTIDNADGSTFMASSTTKWIKNVAVDAENSKVTFDMDENKETTAREGIVNLAYGESLIKDVKVTQGAAVAKRLVTIETPENGTLKMYRGEDEVVTGSYVPQGTELRAEVTPNDGYKFINWQAVDGSTHTYTTNFTYTIGKSDVTFKAKFEQIIYNTITWSVNGTETTEQVVQGTDITFNAPTAGIPEGYEFAGWYGDTYSNATTAPEYVTAAKATGDVTYYAVFAKKSGEGTETTVKVENSDIQTASDADKTARSSYKTDRNINGWTGKYAVPLNSGTYSIMINRNTDSSKGAYNSHVATPECTANIKSITIKTNNNTSKGRTVYLCSSNTIGAATADDATYGSTALDAANGSITIPVVGDTKQLYIYADGTLYIGSIELTYGENATYSDFRTSLETATITLAEACTDGTKYYGTYSSSKPFVVPDDITVSEIKVVDNKLTVKEYATGAVVPANTGVMVASSSFGDHTVALTSETGTSVLGEYNMLRATGDAGVTAAQMAVNDADCKFYRLTMHKGETIGYFYGAAEGAAFNVAANKAYLAVPATVAAKVTGFTFGGDATGISFVTADDNTAGKPVIYNLQGQRVNEKAVKGLYIVNGKKVIIK